MRVFCCCKKDAEPKGSAKSPLPAERGIALNRCRRAELRRFLPQKRWFSPSMIAQKIFSIV